jgi:GAF domain-containing protein
MNTGSAQPAPSGGPGARGPLQQDLKWRDRFVRFVLIGALLLGLLTLAPAVFANRNAVQASLFLAFYVLLALVAAIRTPYWLRLGCFLLLAYTLATASLRFTGISAQSAIFFLYFIVFAAMLWSPRAGVVATAITLVTFGIVAGTMQPGGLGGAGIATVPIGPLDWIAISSAALLFGGGVIVVLRRLEASAGEAEHQVAGAAHEFEAQRTSLQSSMDARTAQLRAVIEVGRAAAAIRQTEQLTAQVVNLISDQFGYYYAAIFLVNEKGDQAELQSATGEACKLLKESKHHLPVGGRSMVGRAISTREPRVALDTGAEPVRFENPLLPYTRSEIALPLVVGEDVLGALDVQSTKAGAFGPTEIETLQGMANQVAIAIENARLFEASRHSLEEMQTVQRQYISSAWASTRTADKREYQVGDEEVPTGSSEMEIPLSLRDEIIGQINVAAASDWTPEQRNLVEAIATQAALALENARLLESSQSSARRDQALADITGKIWASTTIDGILRTALGELGRALDADEASVELKMD